MERPSIFVIILVLLLGVLFLREPRLQRSEEVFLRWLLRHSQPAVKAVPLTIVEIGKETLPPPLETALLLQGLLGFKPTVVAVEPVLEWDEGSKDQEQIFMDQAMRVPKLLLGAKLTASADPDAPVAEITGFTHVTGRRGDLPEFSGFRLLRCKRSCFGCGSRRMRQKSTSVRPLSCRMDLPFRSVPTALSW
jgi:hypothetical protein